MYSTLERTVSLLKRMPSGKITQAILFIWFWICLNHSLVQRPSSKVVDSCILFAYFFPNLILVCSSVNWLIKSLSVCVWCRTSYHQAKWSAKYSFCQSFEKITWLTPLSGGWQWPRVPVWGRRSICGLGRDHKCYQWAS